MGRGGFLLCLWLFCVALTKVCKCLARGWYIDIKASMVLFLISLLFVFLWIREIPHLRRRMDQ